MKELEKFINSSIVKIGFNLLLLVLILGNIYYVVQIDRCGSINTNLNKETKDLTRDLDQLNNKESYQNSKLFSDKQTKLTYKIKGEDIIDMSILEGNSANPRKDYIPDVKNAEKNKLESWTDFLFLNNKTQKDSSFCS